MRLLLLCGLLLASWACQAQQLLCERGLGAYPATAAPYSAVYARGQLTATSPDSCLLYLASPPAGALNSSQSRTRLVWVGRSQCDTASFVRLRVGKTSTEPVAILPQRRGDLLVLGTAVNQTSIDSNHLFLRAYSRRGVLRWARTLRALTFYEIGQTLLEAPDRGAYLTSDPDNAHTRLTKVDSLGRVQWQHVYCPGTYRGFLYRRPSYTVRGNLLLAGSLLDNIGSGNHGLLLEVSQRGDSLTSRPVFDYPGQRSRLLGAHRLRDGGFFVVGQLDTMAPGLYTRMSYARLDANLNVLWTYVHRTLQTVSIIELSQGGLELADGSLLTIAGATNNPIIHLLRISTTGVLLSDYSYQSSHSSSALNESLTPLAADSSFVLAGTPNNVYSTHIDHFRIPGLRRVLPEPPPPPVQVLAARAPAATTFPAPAYPNPAQELVTVPLRPAATPAQLRLLDLTGRLVRSQPVGAGAAQATLAGRGLPPGLYLLQLEAAGQPPATQRLAIGP